MKKLIIISAIFILLPFGEVGRGLFAQTLKRECIASTGSTAILNGTAIQQTIGQPYGTTSYYSNNISYTPGFQQPVFKIKTIKSSINATVFPNPASQQITIEAALPLENISIQITDMNGKIIVRKKTDEFKKSTINCSDWANGVYLITLYNSKNDLYSSKLIISR